MIQLKKSNKRGITSIGWLNSFHSFSFGSYFDPDNVNFGPLRVINDDTVLPGEGFSTHPHKDMEIITIVTEGVIAHKDSTGTDGTIGVMEAQRMTAGSGILHSEFNASDTETLKFFQIWILPDKRGLPPSYQDIKIDQQRMNNNLMKIADKSTEDNVLFINQDAQLYISKLSEGNSVNHKTKIDRGLYLHLISGKLKVEGEALLPGDAVSILKKTEININAESDSLFLLFDLSMNL